MIGYKSMSSKNALRIAAGLYICLGIMVYSVLWLVPELGVPLSKSNPSPQDVITTARGWGDINGTLFCGVGLLLIFCSQNEGLKEAREVMNHVLLGNVILATVLLCMATFHTVVLHHGPPPPVFIACLGSLIVSILGRKGKNTDHNV